MDFYRLGNNFGDVNDIAIFLGLGFAFSVYFVFFSKVIPVKILNSFLTLLFLYTGFSTGSKIFIFGLVSILCFCVFAFFGKKKWYWSAIILIAVVIILVVVLQLPFLNDFKIRILSMFRTLFNINISKTFFDYSTYHRFEMFLNGMEMFLRKPLFGYGVQGFFNYSSFGFAWSHNNFSESLCSFGIIGTILFHFGFFKAVISGFNEFSRKKILSILIFLFFFTSMFSVALNSQKIYAYTIGVAMASLVDEKPLASYSFQTLIEKIRLRRKEK